MWYADVHVEVPALNDIDGIRERVARNSRRRIYADLTPGGGERTFALAHTCTSKRRKLFQSMNQQFYHTTDADILLYLRRWVELREANESLRSVALQNAIVGNNRAWLRYQENRLLITISSALLNRFCMEVD